MDGSSRTLRGHRQNAHTLIFPITTVPLRPLSMAIRVPCNGSTPKVFHSGRFKTKAVVPWSVPWRPGSYELPATTIRELLNLASLGPSDVFADLGSGTGTVVIEAVRTTRVRRAVGVEIDFASRERARRAAFEALTRDQLERVDFMHGDIYYEEFDYSKITAAYNCFQEDEDEVGFYRDRFTGRHLKVLKKDLPLVGYAPIKAFREGRVWLYRTDFPASRIKSKSEWARLALGRPAAPIDDVYEYYQSVLSERGISRRETRLALNQLERLVLLRF